MKGGMKMGMLTYQEMNEWECLDVIRQSHALRAAFFDGEAPYLVPMGFEWFTEGMQPVICLMMPREGRKAAAIRRCDRVCLEWERPGAASLEVVLGEGKMTVIREEEPGLVCAVWIEEISGRRFFLPEG